MSIGLRRRVDRDRLDPENLDLLEQRLRQETASRVGGSRPHECSKAQMLLSSGFAKSHLTSQHTVCLVRTSGKMTGKHVENGKERERYVDQAIQHRQAL